MDSERRSIGVGLMGLGVVGSGVARILGEKRDVYARQIGCEIELRRVLVRDLSKDRAGVAIDRSFLTTNADDLLQDPAIDLIIEVMGGEQPAYDYLREAMAAGKFVVTGNKELMAKHGAEMIMMAREHHVDLLYEASVGGGIPIIAPLKRDLLANDIMSVTAIINGTTNYILTQMGREGTSFEEALAEAKALGYAEPDPTNDVEGHDAAYKLSILAQLSFHMDAHPDDVYREGITKLDASDFSYARELGYAIKLLAIARKEGDAVELRVHPTLVSTDQLMARVDGVLNAVEIEGDLMNRVLFQGPGAGSLPTTSAIVADALDAAVSISNRVYWPHSFRRETSLRAMPMSEVRSRYYLRLLVADRPGVLAQIAGILGEAQISIASVIQKEMGEDGTAEIVIMTHVAQEAGLQTALRSVEALEGVSRVEQLLRVRS